MKQIFGPIVDPLEPQMFHAMARAIGPELMFRDDEDYERFYGLLGYSSRQTRVEICDDCLMGTHYHLQLFAAVPELSKFMHVLQSIYAHYYNEKYDREGHLFFRPYRAYVKAAPALQVFCSLYIQMNPVAAGLVQRPEEYRYSSYRALIGLERPRPHLRPKRLLACLSPDPAESRKIYLGIVASRLRKGRIEGRDAQLLDAFKSRRAGQMIDRGRVEYLGYLRGLLRDEFEKSLGPRSTELAAVQAALLMVKLEGLTLREASALVGIPRSSLTRQLLRFDAAPEEARRLLGATLASIAHTVEGNGPNENS